ncbi:MAG TPA: SDR family oxidoreductase [Nevskiaceae bacterium]|nr:SDR family oxidoreductase [Nevskiaceae bacterium]
MSDPRKSIFITGAAAGIGRATAQRFAREGWLVGLYDVDAPALQALSREIGPANCRSAVLDVTDADAVSRAVNAFAEAAGERLDVMFNNAGIAHNGPFEEVPIGKAHAIVDVNLKGVINGCYAALPHLRITPGACLINMASASAIYGAPNLAVYSSTKFAVKGLTEALDLEWRRYGIRVLDIQPLFVATPMVANMTPGLPSLKRLGLKLSAEQIADCVWQAAIRPGGAVHRYPGAQTRAFALAAKLSPAWVNRAVNRLVQT